MRDKWIIDNEKKMGHSTELFTCHVMREAGFSEVVSGSGKQVIVVVVNEEQDA